MDKKLVVFRNHNGQLIISIKGETPKAFNDDEIIELIKQAQKNLKEAEEFEKMLKMEVE